ncbi:MAG: hypothetical protein HN548_02430 [Opitutae bacterium]|nr:hypothetical protein [Opitutae bacterium]
MINCWSRFAKNTTLIVVDNSTDIDSRDEIRVICISNNIHYVSLPKNPEWHPNRSHALAMNWVYYNLTKKLSPKFFGFLDHDCFPFAEFDLNRKLNKKVIYGEKRISEKNPKIWSLWAGFCFFNYSSMGNKKINFTHSIELGLDTGGSNWNGLYKSIKFEDQCSFSQVCMNNELRLNFKQDFNSVIDNFVHIGSVSHQFKGNEIDEDQINFFLEYLADEFIKLSYGR